MTKFDPKFGAKKAEQRRFRLFMFIMLPVLVGLGSLVFINPMEISKTPRHEQSVSFTNAVKEIWGAIWMTYSLEYDETGRPIPPPYEE